MRGEEWRCSEVLHGGEEIPPRARRRGPSPSASALEPGNTSACAEKSHDWHSGHHRWSKYLRVRGEEPLKMITFELLWEIPPRARRRGNSDSYGCWRCGNTSACAEKSQLLRCKLQRRRKYLRVRGEESRGMRRRSAMMEIPPRARRRVLQRNKCLIFSGNTSACAEKRR